MAKQTITKALIKDIVEASHQLAGYQLILGEFHDLSTVRVPAAWRPATVDSLRALATHLQNVGLPFPPSYRAFLSISDGIEHFGDDLNLLGAREAITPPHEGHTRVFGSLSTFQIGRSKETLEFIAFDASAGLDREEPEVVWIADNGEESRDDSFTAFLCNRLDTLIRNIDQSKARISNKAPRKR